MIETITMTIERGEDYAAEIEVTCRVECERGCRGHRDRYGAPEEPDTPASFEYLDAKTMAGAEIELTRSEELQAEDKAAEQLATQYRLELVSEMSPP